MESSKIDMDQVFRRVGQFGKWQLKNAGLINLCMFAPGLSVVTWAFTSFNMDNRCAIPYCEDTGSHFKTPDGHFPNFVSPDLNGKCQFYSYTGDDPDISCAKYTEKLKSDKTDLTLTSCAKTDLIFDRSVVNTSLATDYGLYCDDLFWRSALGTTYMIGMLFGSFFLGMIADKYGRLKGFALSILIVSSSASLGAFMKDAYGFAVARFLTGVGGIGCFMVGFVLTVEIVGPQFKMPVSILTNIPFAFGGIVFGLEAYFIRDWATLQLVAHLPLLLLLLLCLAMRESPRWLLSVGREEEAKKLIDEMAKTNGKSLSENLVKRDIDVTQEDPEEVQVKAPSTHSIIELFRSSRSSLRLMNMMYQWTCTTLCYFGLSFASTSLLGDPYTNFILCVFVEIPGYLFNVFVMDCWGRRPMLIFLQIISGLSCIAAGMLFNVESMAVVQVAFCLLGKFGAAACFSMVYIYTAELFPTYVRSSAIGICSAFARVGGVGSLLIEMLKVYWGPLPMVIMGGTSILAGLMAVAFPETVGLPLPDTMEQAMNLGKSGRKRKLWHCSAPTTRLRDCLALARGSEDGEEYEKETLDTE